MRKISISYYFITKLHQLRGHKTEGLEICKSFRQARGRVAFTSLVLRNIMHLDGIKLLETITG